MTIICFKAQLLEQQHREDHERMHLAIADLMKDAANKTKQEIEALKKIYNINLEKLIGEYNILEMVFIVPRMSFFILGYRRSIFAL